MAESPNRKIPRPQAELLWGASAARCNICNTSLIRDETTGVEIKAGEKAHIVGVADAPRSPRGHHPLPVAERNLAANLILLCEKHHTEVDKRTDVYTPEQLLELKRRFEERVFFLTGLGEDNETQVFRLNGAIHGTKTPDLTREQAREVVLREEGRYPRYSLSASEHDASVDLRQLTNEGEAAYWEEARRQIDQRVAHLEQLRAEGRAGHVSVFALARIPVLIALGDALGDAADVSVYHRRNQGGWGWDSEAELPRFELIEHQLGDGDQVLLACSLSAPVRFDRAPADLAGQSRYEIRPAGLAPGATLLDHPDALHAFAQAYRHFLSTVEAAHPGATAINLLPAIPGDAAIALGQIRTPAANPPMRVYDLNRESDAYAYACEVGG
jgi:hypothetical protein